MIFERANDSNNDVPINVSSHATHIFGWKNEIEIETEYVPIPYHSSWESDMTLELKIIGSIE